MALPPHNVILLAVPRIATLTDKPLIGSLIEDIRDGGS